MVIKTTITCLVNLLLACLVSSQSCPPNTAMGLCQSVPKPCFGDSDCVNGEMCCPEACSRSCKPRLTRPVSRDISAPDLLNDPRVYVGKCPDASCYNMFGGEPNECSTSNLCQRGKICCSDGCKNVCQWTPEYAAMIAQEEARVKTQQHLIIQRQQEEMRRRQQEMYEQRQRQLATAELARKQAEARAAAEAELAAQQARAKYEANLRAVAVAQSKAVSALQQRMVAQQKQQQFDARQQSAAAISNSGIVDNFVGDLPAVNSINSGSSLDQPTLLQEQRTSPVSNKLNSYFSAMKREQQAGSLVNQINSPASANPYNSESQQSVKVKNKQSELLSLIQSSPSISALQTSIRNKEIFPRYSRPVTFNQEVATLDQAQQYPLRPTQKIQSIYQDQSLTPTYPANPSFQYPAQNYQLSQPLTSYAYQSVGQAGASNAYYEQPGQGSVDPLLMYHAMQTAA